MQPGQLFCALRSYYPVVPSIHRDLQEFYDLESRLHHFDHVSRILGAHKRRILLRWIRDVPV